MDGIIHIENFINNPTALYDLLINKVAWMIAWWLEKQQVLARLIITLKSAIHISLFFQNLEAINKDLIPVIGFEPNNCLINYYPSGKSKMGFHSDQTDILEPNTGIVIVSVGALRTLIFRNIIDPETFLNYELASGSLIYMSQEIQKDWQHAIPKADTE